MKTIQSFNDPNKIHYNLPAPTYTSTEASTLKDQLQKERTFPDIKNSYEYKKQYSGISENTLNDDEEIDNHGNVYSNKHKISLEGKEKSRKIKQNHNKSEDYQSPYIQNQYQARRNLAQKLKKNGSAGSVISAKKSAADSEVSGLIVRNNISNIVGSNVESIELPMIDKTKSQESLITESNKGNVNKISDNQPKYTPERIKDRESRLSSDNQSNNSRVKHRVLEPSEFKMRNDFDGSNSPTRRLIDNKKSRLKSNHSKEMNRNDSQSQLSNKKLQRNDSQRELSNDNNILASSERNENSKSKKMIKNLREHIALKLYEHNIPSSNYHRVVGKAGYQVGNNSYIQKMLDAYNVFNYPQAMGNSKHNNKLKKYLRKDGASSKNKDAVNNFGRNKSIDDKNNYSPDYNKDNSVVLPELSRSPGISLISNRKKSIISMKKKQAEKYMRSGKRNNAKIASINNSPNKSTDLESMPSISKQLDRILNSHKMNINQNVKNYRSPNHLKIKSISNEKERRELAIDGLPSNIIKPIYKSKVRDDHLHRKKKQYY